MLSLATILPTSFDIYFLLFIELNIWGRTNSEKSYIRAKLQCVGKCRTKSFLKSDLEIDKKCFAKFCNINIPISGPSLKAKAKNIEKKSDYLLLEILIFNLRSTNTLDKNCQVRKSLQNLLITMANLNFQSVLKRFVLV